MTSFIPWVGGKGRLLPYIQGLMPPKVDRFVDVFGGSASVTLGLNLPKNCMRVYNDYNSNLTNLVFCVQYKPAALVKELGFLSFNSRDGFTILKRHIEGDEFLDDCFKEELELIEQNFDSVETEEIRQVMLEKAALDDVRRAAAYYKMVRYSFSGGGNSFGGKPCDIRLFFHQIWEASRQLRNVVIENKDFESVIKQYDRKNGFIYCDPPYYEAEKCYKVEFPKKDHYRLRKAILKCRGFVMVSYNYCPFICELYKDFFIYRVERPNSMSQTEGSMYEEAIITNYDPRSYYRQMSLFSSPSDNVRKIELINIPKMPLGTHSNGKIIFKGVKKH